MTRRICAAGFAVPALLMLAVAAAPRAVQSAEPEPEALPLQRSSAHDHDLVLSWLGIADERSYARLLNAYDDYLLRNPDDVPAAVGRCRFIERARYDEDVHDFNPNSEAFEECLQKLKERFPDEPSVILMDLESTWGEQAIEQAEALIQNEFEGWDSAQIARAYRHLALHHGYQGDLMQAARAAHEAMRLDPSLDLTLTLARYWEREGNDENVLLSLQPYIDAPAESWELGEKAALLVEVGAHELAVQVYRRLEEDPEGEPDRLVYARALEGTGDLFGARDQYVLAVEEHWDQQEAQRRLFFFDLEHREGWAAAHSYQLLRDSGFGADPLLRHRLELAWKHPSVPWRWRDAWGALLLLGIAVCVAAVPATWILPVHYFGLIRRARSPELEHEPGRFGLRHCWYVSAWILLVNSLVIYAFAYEDLDSLLADPFSLSIADEAKLARMALFGVTLTVVGLLPMLRLRDYELLVRSQWTALRTILMPLGVLAVLWVTVAVPVYLVARELASSGAVLAGCLPVGASVTMKVVEALGTTYGLAVQTGVVVLLAPAYEELVFRGVILQGCGRHVSFAWANLIQAGLFTVSHESAVHYPQYFAMAVAAGILARRSRGLGAPALLHVTNNGIALFAIRSWGLGS